MSCMNSGVLDEDCHANYLQCHSLSGKKSIGKCLTLKFGKDRARIACIEENDGGQNQASSGPREGGQRSENQFSANNNGRRPGQGSQNNQSKSKSGVNGPYYSDHNKYRHLNGPSPNSKIRQNFEDATKSGTWDGPDRSSTNDRDSNRVTYGRENTYAYNYNEKIQESYDHKEDLKVNSNPQQNINLIAQVISELAKEQPNAAQHFKDMWELKQESKREGVPVPKKILNEMISFKMKFMMDNPKWAAMFREAKRRQYNAKLKIQGVTGHNIHEKKEVTTSNKKVPNRNKGSKKGNKPRKGPRRSKGKGMMARSLALPNGVISITDENLVETPAEITPEMMAMIDIWKNTFPVLEQGPFNQFNRDIDTYIDSIHEGVVDYLALNGLNKFFMMHGLEKLGEWSRFKEIVKAQGLMF